jgi:HEAT repeat protein
MSESKKRKFGPLLYAALLAWGLVAIFACVETGAPMLQRWLEARRLAYRLQSADPDTRWAALTHLEPNDFTSVRSYVIQALQDPIAKVRVSASRILANHGTELPRVIPVLSAGAADQDVTLRCEAVACLGRVLAQLAHPRPGVDARSSGQESGLTIESLEVLYRSLKDQSSDVRAEAARAVGVAGPAISSTGALVAAADDPERSVRQVIAEALLQLNGSNDGTAAKILCELIADPGPVADRPRVLSILQRTSDATQDQAMKALASLLSHAEPAVLPDVIACLGEAGPRARAALPALEKLLDDSEPTTRAAAVMAILAMDGPEPGMAAMGMRAMGLGPMMSGGMAAAGATSETSSTARQSPRVLAVLLEMITEKELPQEWRSDAFGRLKELAPAMVSKATSGLIVQLGDPSVEVRFAALELLQMILQDTRAEMPGPAAAK